MKPEGKHFLGYGCNLKDNSIHLQEDVYLANYHLDQTNRRQVPNQAYQT